MKVEIAYLADHPEFVPLLAAWFYDEWGGDWPYATLEGFIKRLEGRLNRDQPPITYLGFYGQEPVGTAALKIREMETHPQFEYWLGSVYVRDDYRRQGIASSLIQAVIDQSRVLGIDRLYLYTRQKEPLYAKFGWKVIETPKYRGKVVSIMERCEAG
jgi:GNAT superfamily N-acetyltransferase